MPLTYDSNQRRYVWTSETTPQPGDRDYGRYASAGQIIPDLPATRQFGIAAESMFPGYQESPYLSQSIGRLADPLYGQYILNAPFADTAPGATPVTGAQEYQRFYQGDPRQEFVDWIQNRGMSEPIGIPTGPPVNWEDLIRVARSQALTRPAGTQDLTGSLMASRWGPVLSDRDQINSLMGMALYDPRAGSILGQQRQRGINALSRSWEAANPGSQNPAADFLGYLTSTNILPEAWRVAKDPGLDWTTRQEAVQQIAPSF